MKILFTPTTFHNNNDVRKPINSPHYISNNFIKMDTVSFSGKAPAIKRPDINLEIKKLLRQIDEILKSGGDISFEERKVQAYQRIITQKFNIALKVEALNEEVEKHLARTDVTSASYREEISTLLAKIQNLKRQNNAKVVIKNPTTEEIKADYKLLNLFKSSIINEHFDLKKVFFNYYSDLNKIHTVDELAERFPKLIPPQKPENVIADKILNSLTRDFFEKLDELLKKEDCQDAAEFIYKAIESTHNIPLLKNKDINIINTYDRKIGSVFGKKVLRKYQDLMESGSFSSVPIVRKIKNVDISENDFKLLMVDYDDFVLHTFKEMYLNGKKFKDIKFYDGKTEIDYSKISDKCYKVDKVSERIKKFISDAYLIRTHQRDYEKFTTEELKNRISYYSDKIENNETLLEKMIDFMLCRFHEEDKPMITKFLRELDAIWDGEKTASEAIETINKLNLRPVGTEKLNEAERKAALIQKSLENKEFLKLSQKQALFDDVINLLFQNNMNFAAEICSKYRPTAISTKEFQHADFLINLINEFKIRDKDVLFDKNILETRLKRWDSYITFTNNTDNPQLLDSIHNFARTSDNIIDIEKAGQYLLNREIILDYPRCLEYYKNPELLSRIMELCGNEKDIATEALCKYESYLDMKDNDKTLISKIIEKFDIKNLIDKFILKNIIENEYIYSDTVEFIKINDNNILTTPAKIMSKAKQDILNYYRFPECLNIFKAFEEALSSRASNRYSAGIKRVLGDNMYSYELKIMGYPDRLLAKDDKLNFEIFCKQGLH